MSQEQSDLTSVIQFLRFDTTSDTSEVSFEFPEIKYGEPIFKKYTNPTNDVSFVLYIGDMDGNPIQVGQNFVPVHDIFDFDVHTWVDFSDKSMIPISTDSTGIMEARRLRFNDMSGMGLRHTMTTHTGQSNCLWITRGYYLDESGLEPDNYQYDNEHKYFEEWGGSQPIDANDYSRTFEIDGTSVEYTGANYNLNTFFYDERNPDIEYNDERNYFLISELLNPGDPLSYEQRGLKFFIPTFDDITGILNIDRLESTQHERAGEVLTTDPNGDSTSSIITNSLMLIGENNEPFHRMKLYTDRLQDDTSNETNTLFIEVGRTTFESSATILYPKGIFYNSELNSPQEGLAIYSTQPFNGSYQRNSSFRIYARESTGFTGVYAKLTGDDYDQYDYKIDSFGLHTIRNDATTLDADYLQTQNYDLDKLNAFTIGSIVYDNTSLAGLTGLIIKEVKSGCSTVNNITGLNNIISGLRIDKVEGVLHDDNESIGNPTAFIYGDELISKGNSYGLRLNKVISNNPEENTSYGIYLGTTNSHQSISSHYGISKGIFLRSVSGARGAVGLELHSMKYINQYITHDTNERLPIVGLMINPCDPAVRYDNIKQYTNLEGNSVVGIYSKGRNLFYNHTTNPLAAEFYGNTFSTGSFTINSTTNVDNVINIEQAITQVSDKNLAGLKIGNYETGNETWIESNDGIVYGVNVDCIRGAKGSVGLFVRQPLYTSDNTDPLWTKFPSVGVFSTSHADSHYTNMHEYIDYLDPLNIVDETSGRAFDGRDRFSIISVGRTFLKQRPDEDITLEVDGNSSFRGDMIIKGGVSIHGEALFKDVVRVFYNDHSSAAVETGGNKGNWYSGLRTFDNNDGIFGQGVFDGPDLGIFLPVPLTDGQPNLDNPGLYDYCKYYYDRFVESRVFIFQNKLKFGTTLSNSNRIINMLPKGRYHGERKTLVYHNNSGGIIFTRLADDVGSIRLLLSPYTAKLGGVKGFDDNIKPLFAPIQTDGRAASNFETIPLRHGTAIEMIYLLDIYMQHQLNIDLNLMDEQCIIDLESQSYGAWYPVRGE